MNARPARSRSVASDVDRQLSGFETYPGYDLVRTGLVDLNTGRESVEALLVVVAADRLRRHGLPVSSADHERAKERLWHLLEAEVGHDAHARYNALISRIVSFANTADSLRKGTTSALEERMIEAFGPRPDVPRR